MQSFLIFYVEVLKQAGRPPLPYDRSAIIQKLFKTKSASNFSNYMLI